MNTVMERPQTTHKVYIDYLKAIAAVFVVLGHSITYLDNYAMPQTVIGNLIGVLVSSVHVPLFFVIAGYFCHKQQYGKYIKKKVMRIIVPYFTFGVLKIAYSFLLSGDHSHCDSFSAMLYDTFVVGGAYWFAYCMFFIYIMAMLFWGKDSKDSQKKICIAVIVSVAFVAFNILSSIFNLNVFPETASFGTGLKSPLFQVERVLMYLPYFMFGFVIQQYKDSFSAFLQKRKILLLGISLALTVGLAYLIVADYLSKGYAAKMLLAFSLMFLLRLVAMALPQNIGILKTAAKYSLQIMFFDSFYRVILFALAARFITPNLSVALIITAADVALACISCIIIEKIPYVKTLFGL